MPTAPRQSEPFDLDARAGGCAAHLDSLRAWLDWQGSIHVRDIDLGLERTRAVAARMGLSAPAHAVVTVAGTNGKGSSVAMLDAILRSAGYRVATYTSPHLLRYNERIRVDGVEAGDGAICEVFERIEHARNGVPLTYFEYGTLAALALFEEARPDIAILEVGLGGRLDAVNIVDPDVALIAALGIDHVAWLGETREAIAREKAGIMRAGRPAVCSDPAVPGSIIERAREIGAHLELLGQTFRFETAGNRWRWWSRDRVIDDLPAPNLMGCYQLRNAAGVLKVVALLNHRYPVADAHIREALQTVRLPGRFQRVTGTVEHVLDVAHNEQAMRVFVETLRTLPAARRTHALLGMLKTKDHAKVFEALAPVVDRWHLATLPAAHGATSGELRVVLSRGRPDVACTCYDDVEQGYEAMLRDARPGDRVLVTGSFLTVGPVLQRLTLPRQ